MVVSLTAATHETALWHEPTDRRGRDLPTHQRTAMGVPAVWILSRAMRSEHFITLLSQPRKKRSQVAVALRKGQPIAAEDMPIARAVVAT